MRQLIIIGATGEKIAPELSELIKNRIHERWPDYVRYADTREEAYELLGENGGNTAVLAYAPGVFGDCVAGGKLSPKIWTGEPQVILTTTGRPEDLHQTDDPRQFVEAAMLMLGIHTPALNVENETSMDILDMILSQESPEAS